MDKDIKLLLKIVGISYLIIVLLLLLFIFSSYFKSIFLCEYTGGDWIFNKADEKFCSSLNASECDSNLKCVRTSSLEDFDNPKCVPDSGCVCGISWSSRGGCANGKWKSNELVGRMFFIGIFLFFTLVFLLLLLLIINKKKFKK